ncbi:helix-turn-helix domain-containing protein [Ekhidna sp.]
MNFSRELLFFFSALGAFNGLIIGLYFLLFAKPKHRSNYFLGILLLALSIRIGKSVFLYFNDDLAAIYLQLGISACLFVGPSLFFYLKAITRPTRSLQWKLHYVTLLIAIVAIGIIYPWEFNPKLWRYFFNAIYLIWLIYLIASAVTIKDTIIRLFKRSEKLSPMEIWIISIYFGNLIIWIAYNTTRYTSYIVGALSFSFVFYLLILLLVLTRKKDPSFLNKYVKYGNKKIDPNEASDLLNQLNDLLIKEKLYKDANLKLADLAQRLNVLPHYLSQLINESLNKNFTSYLNEYRINEAKQLIEAENHLKLESIGYECGFNSKSTFYTAFKKASGTTPAKFKENLES